MPNISQTESGKAWEYGLARKFADVLTNTNLVMDIPRMKASYDLLNHKDRNRIDNAAAEAVTFLMAFDDRLHSAKRVSIQSDLHGKIGDVRDIIIHTENEEIGISAKHRHQALKHSRISGTIDFGKEWYDKKCSQKYWGKIKPIFEDLRDKKEAKINWRDIPNKHTDYYLPVLQALIDEIKSNGNPALIVSYLIGRFDFYKIIKVNGNISIQSFNLHGTLKWGEKVPLPTNIIHFDIKEKSKTTAIITFDRGWQISFRLHNAESKVIPSMKFDIQLIGNPKELTKHTFNYG